MQPAEILRPRADPAAVSHILQAYHGDPAAVSLRSHRCIIEILRVYLRSCRCILEIAGVSYKLQVYLRDPEGVS